MLEPYYTVREVAESLKMHPVVINRLIREGRIEASKTNGETGHYRISKDAIQTYLEERKQRRG